MLRPVWDSSHQALQKWKMFFSAKNMPPNNLTNCRLQIDQAFGISGHGMSGYENI
jgi:hypothetical protein